MRHANRCIVCGDVLMKWEREYHSSCGEQNEWREPEWDWLAWSDEVKERRAEMERRINYDECVENSKNNSAAQN